MCGFYGIISDEFNYTNDELEIVSDTISHRGPDAKNDYYSKIDKKHIYYSHNRLSIIDLTNNGTQPFISEDENLVLIFNGEIYNYKEIKNELKKQNFKFNTNTDTEVLLKSWEAWGENSLKKLRGMFSFSIIDKKKNKAFFVRDHFGMKPLYYYKDEKNFFFASEIICILKLLKEKVEINYNTAYQYLVYGNHDHTSETFFEKINQIRPGELISIEFKNFDLVKYKWWKPSTELLKDISFEEAKIKIRNLFLDSIKKHLNADVKTGVALSGGIDSSSIVSAIKYLYPENKINLLSFISKNKNSNESYWINQVEEFVKENSIKVYDSKKNLTEIIDQLIKLQGEPFGDSSILSEYLIFNEAKKNNIKVLLMGHGGDEVFVGYDGYPGTMFKYCINNFKFLQLIIYFFNWKKKNNSSFTKLFKKLCNEIFSGKLKSFLLDLIGIKKKPNWLNLSFLKKKNVYIGLKEENCNFSTNRFLANKQLNSTFYKNLPAMLRYADRSSMKNSIECRLPFLYEDIFSYILRLPEEYLIPQNGTTKFILRESLKDLLPKKLLYRNDKIGYHNIESDLLERIIESTNVEDDINFLNHTGIKKILKSKNKTDVNLNLQKWRIINFIRWKNIFKEHLYF